MFQTHILLDCAPLQSEPVMNIRNNQNIIRTEMKLCTLVILHHTHTVSRYFRVSFTTFFFRKVHNKTNECLHQSYKGVVDHRLILNTVWTVSDHALRVTNILIWTYIYISPLNIFPVKGKSRKCGDLCFNSSISTNLASERPGLYHLVWLLLSKPTSFLPSPIFRWVQLWHLLCPNFVFPVLLSDPQLEGP